jgi:hypothetical protein
VNRPPPRPRGRPAGLGAPVEGLAGPGQAATAPLDRAPVELPGPIGLEEDELGVHVVQYEQGV